MIKVDLLKELKDNAKESALSAENALSEVKALLDAHEQEDRTMLEYAGLDSKIKAADDIKGELLERKIFINKYGEIITASQINDICLKYNLKCLPISKYKGNIGPLVAKDIKNFITMHGLEGDARAGNFKRKLFIMAPKELFQYENRPKDPILLYCPNSSYGEVRNEKEYFTVVSKWGEDFTFTQRIKGLLDVKFFLTHYSIALFLVIPLVLSLVATVSTFDSSISLYDTLNFVKYIWLTIVAITYLGVMYLSKNDPESFDDIFKTDLKDNTPFTAYK